jgi:hypothetical protein
MEHAVIVHIPLSTGQFGTEDERKTLFHVEDRLVSAIDRAGAGEFDGNEFGEGEATFYMYGPDADRLFKAVEPVLRLHPVFRGAYAVKRYGPAVDPASREQRVEL